MWLLSLAQMLTVVATGAEPRMPGAAGSTGLPDPISTRQTYFAIPFEIDQRDHPVLGAVEIQLYVSRDRGTTWQHETSVNPATKHFLYRAPDDGEFWFAVRTKDRAGNLRPPLVSGPGLRVVVDTKAPRLSIEAQRGQAGQIIAKWKVDEAHVKPETLKLQYRVGESQQWETVAIDTAKIRTDSASQSGEVAWWPPAGQGRVEIRAEVADAAGNRNVSHAQVTNSGAMPASDSMAGTSYRPASPASSDEPWLPTSNRSQDQSTNTWSQSASSARGQSTPAAASPTYPPYSQEYAEDTNIGNRSAGSWDPSSNSSFPPAEVSGYGSSPAGTNGSGFGGDRATTAGNPQSQRTPTTPSAAPAGRSLYAQGPQSSGQFGDRSNRGLVASGPNHDWSGSERPGGFEGRGVSDAVAAQPAPAYQSQYRPGDRSPGQTSSTSARGQVGQSRANPAAGSRIVNSRLFELDYTEPQQPLAVGRVELWGTRDGGRTWKSFGYDSDSRSPMIARVPDEGLYGFKVVFRPIHGPDPQPPRPGQSPDTIVRVDLTQPQAQLLSVAPSPNRPNELTIRWRVSDSALADSPISLYYADAATGQWRPIARNLANSGDYRWVMPADMPTQVQIRVEAADRAGNVASAETRSPIRVARVSQRRQVGPQPQQFQIQDVRPVGQTGNTGPRRYYIR